MVKPNMESVLNKVVKFQDYIVKTEQEDCLDLRPMKYRVGQKMISIMWSNSLYGIPRGVNQQRTNQTQDQREEARRPNEQWMESQKTN